MKPLAYRLKKIEERHAPKTTEERMLMAAWGNPKPFFYGANFYAIPTVKKGVCGYIVAWYDDDGKIRKHGRFSLDIGSASAQINYEIFNKRGE